MDSKRGLKGLGFVDSEKIIARGSGLGALEPLPVLYTGYKTILMKSSNTEYLTQKVDEQINELAKDDYTVSEISISEPNGEGEIVYFVLMEKQMIKERK